MAQFQNKNNSQSPASSQATAGAPNNDAQNAPKNAGQNNAGNPADPAPKKTDVQDPPLSGEEQKPKDVEAKR